jgi:FixJ family two-component response regulator
MIAVVDDDESVCRALKRLVRTFGMDADTFASGQAFLETLTARPSYHVDCVILDLQMPGLNGLQVQEQLARIRRLPVIFITAHEEPGVREQALGAGAAAFVRKPFNDEVFIDTLRAAIRGGAGGAPA